MEYQDRCEIIRMDGTVDAFGEEIGSPIYNGKADLQLPLGHSGNPYTGFEFEHEPILFIPVNNIFFKINDYVKVTTFYGRILEYTILNWEPIKDDDFEELNNTCLWLKDGRE